MPFDGSGTFNLTQDFSADRDAGPPASQISADKMMSVLSDIALAIDNLLALDGQNSPKANISWNNWRLTSLAAATAPQDAPRSRQVAENTIDYWGLTTGTSVALAASNAFVTAVAVGTLVRATASVTNADNATFAAGGSAGNIVEKDGNQIKAGRIINGKSFEVSWDGTHWVLEKTGSKVFDAAIVALNAIAQLVPAADQLPYFNGASGAALTTLTAFARTLLADADQATMQATLGFFQAGTAMPFVQTSAPTGWTKSTTHNDKVPRFVSGAASSGGSTAFSTVFAARTVAQANLPNVAPTFSGNAVLDHTHGVADGDGNFLVGGRVGSGSSGWGTSGGAFSKIQGVGLTSAGGHTPSGSISSINGGVGQTTMDFAVQYVDMIIATKN